MRSFATAQEIPDEGFDMNLFFLARIFPITLGWSAKACCSSSIESQISSTSNSLSGMERDFNSSVAAINPPYLQERVIQAWFCGQTNVERIHGGAELGAGSVPHIHAF